MSSAVTTSIWRSLTALMPGLPGVGPSGSSASWLSGGSLSPPRPCRRGPAAARHRSRDAPGPGFRQHLNEQCRRHRAASEVSHIPPAPSRARGCWRARACGNPSPPSPDATGRRARARSHRRPSSRDDRETRPCRRCWSRGCRNKGPPQPEYRVRLQNPVCADESGVIGCDGMQSPASARLNGPERPLSQLGRRRTARIGEAIPIDGVRTAMPMSALLRLQRSRYSAAEWLRDTGSARHARGRTTSRAPSLRAGRNSAFGISRASFLAVLRWRLNILGESDDVHRRPHGRQAVALVEAQGGIPLRNQRSSLSPLSTHSSSSAFSFGQRTRSPSARAG